jgi:hypothetical protein
MSDWTRTETVSPPDEITIEYVNIKPDSNAEKKSVSLTSTSRGTSKTTYTAINYTDRDGKPQVSEVSTKKVDVTWKTIASVNEAYVASQLTNDAGLPSGGAKSENVTTSEYAVTVDGPILVRETTEHYVSMAEFSGGLQLTEWGSFQPSGEEMILAHRTIREIELAKTAEGRDVTRTKTSRWIARAELAAGKNYGAKYVDQVKTLLEEFSELIEPHVRSMIPLRYEGTEVQIETGRMPVAEKPSDQEIARDDVTKGREKEERTEAYENRVKYDENGDPIIPDPDDEDADYAITTFASKASFPPVGKTQKLVAATGGGFESVDLYYLDASTGKVYRWDEDDRTYYEAPPPGQTKFDIYTPTNPTSWTEYDDDKNNDGVPDWADYVPPALGGPSNWETYDVDSNSDGIPDWKDFVPVGDDFNTADFDYNDPEADTTTDKVIYGTVFFDGSWVVNPLSTVTATYDMPFTPDDHFVYVKGIPKLVRGNAAAAAAKFGEIESALDIGHAYGQNIVTGWNETPTLDLAPIYLQVAGIEGAFLMDSTSYAWGPDGMVVSSDLMLLGVSGYYGASAPASSWLRLPVPVAGLQQVTAGTTGTASKANSIAIPVGFNARNPGAVLAALPSNGADSYALFRGSQNLIGPTLGLEQTTLATEPALVAREFPYQLVVTPEAAVLATGPAIKESTIITPPAAGTSVAALAPVVASGASVAIPVAVVSVAALVPVVQLTRVVEVPAAALTIGALVPEQVGRPRIEVLMPAVGVTVAALAPEVLTGMFVEVPAAVVTMAGLAPRAGVVSGYFSSMAEQLYTASRDWLPDWWGD